MIVKSENATLNNNNNNNSYANQHRFFTITQLMESSGVPQSRVLLNEMQNMNVRGGSIK